MDKLIDKKIIAFVIYIGFLLLSLEISGQDISLKNIKTENTIKAEFYFEVVNVSDSFKVYSVSLEKWRNDKGWYEINGDVFNYTATKKTRTFRIAGKSITKHFFYPGKLIVGTYKHNKYRLKINYGNTFANKDLTSYSDIFIFK